VIRAIVLAAGKSTRMGEPKALLKDGNGRTFVARVLHTLRAADVADLTVVTGAVHGFIVAAVALDAPRSALVRFAQNPDPDRGQLSSLQTGLDTVATAGVDAILVTLVDVPFVLPATVRAVVDEWRRTRAPIVRPAIGERHGHPVLFSREVFDELRSADASLGAKAVVRAHSERIVNVPVEDEGALIDLDTPEEYVRAVRS
jgi:molybdenum cofactor cytidylyltransferase